MIILVLAPIVLPALAGLAYAAVGWQRRTAWVGALGAAGVLACGIALAVVVTRTDPRTGLGGLLRADALQRVHGDRHRRHRRAGDRGQPRATWPPSSPPGTPTPARTRRYGVLVQAFVAAMRSPCWPPTSACCGWPSRPPPSSPRSWSGTGGPAARSRPRGSTS